MVRFLRAFRRFSGSCGSMDDEPPKIILNEVMGGRLGVNPAVSRFMGSDEYLLPGQLRYLLRTILERGAEDERFTGLRRSYIVHT